MYPASPQKHWWKGRPFLNSVVPLQTKWRLVPQRTKLEALQYGQENPLQLYSLIPWVATGAVMPSALDTRADMGGVEEVMLTLRPKMLGNHLLHVGPVSGKEVATAVGAVCGEEVPRAEWVRAVSGMTFLISWITNL